MKEIPILFSSPMVRGIRSGRKTQTRRILKPGRRQEWLEPDFLQTCGVKIAWADGRFGVQLLHPAGGPATWIACPYGAPGCRLWVRETWQVARETLDWETGGEYDVFAWEDDLYGPAKAYLNGNARGGTSARVFYAADGEDVNPSHFYDPIGLNGEVLREREITWRPSIHMPRWACRITLDVIKVSVERLQDITEADAIAEGIIEYEADREEDGDPAEFAWDEELGRGEVFPTAVAAYRDLWERLNGRESWEANPWVWVIEFPRQEPAHVG